jgi:hypothetical protein
MDCPPADTVEREILIGIRAARDIAGREGWLSHTPPDFRTAILDRASLQSFSSGATIYMVGAPPGGIYGMISGGAGFKPRPATSGPSPRTISAQAHGLAKARSSPTGLA